MRSFDEPFRGLPAEIRLMIWGYVALPVIELTPINSKYALDFLIAVTQSNRTVYQELKVVIAQHGLSFDAISLTKASIKPLWRSIPFRSPLISKIKLLRLQATRPDKYDGHGVLLWEIWQSNFNLINESPDNGSCTPIDRLEYAVSGDMLEDAAEKIVRPATPVIATRSALTRDSTAQRILVQSSLPVWADQTLLHES